MEKDSKIKLMTRSKKIKLNTFFGLANQLIALVCGFILPRFILKYYGSEVNGLVSSITQFLSLITLCELGVGAVVQSALYKPLAINDEVGVSKIMISARRFFNRIGIIMLIYVVVLMVVLPLNQLESFDFLTTALLVASMSITYFAQYFFGIKNQLLLNADQKSYVQLILQIVTVILNTVVCVILIILGSSIQVVKLATSVIFLLRPLGLMLYVRKNYKIDYSLTLTEEPIKQKWNGLTHHLASVVLQNTDTVVLTFFSTLVNVSIYNVYHMVVIGVRHMVESLTIGVQALFGNMLAKGETEELEKTFSRTEWLLHTVAVLAFTIAGVLIVPFVKVYTSGVTDANYIVPTFAVLICMATASYCLRFPYYIMVKAAGYYKETQLSAIVEMVINILLSIVLVFKLGLSGVAIGTFVAMTYRTIYFALYLRKNIINRPIKHFIKHMLVNVLTVGLIVLATFWIKLGAVNYLSWFIMAIEVGVIALAIMFIVNIIFYKNQTLSIFKSIKSKFFKRSVKK